MRIGPLGDLIPKVVAPDGSALEAGATVSSDDVLSRNTEAQGLNGSKRSASWAYHPSGAKGSGLLAAQATQGSDRAHPATRTTISARVHPARGRLLPRQVRSERRFLALSIRVPPPWCICVVVSEGGSIYQAWRRLRRRQSPTQPSASRPTVAGSGTMSRSASPPK